MNTISFSQLCVGDYFTLKNDPSLLKKAEDWQGHPSFYVAEIGDSAVGFSKRMIKRDVDEDWMVGLIPLSSNYGKLILNAASQRWVMKDEAVQFIKNPYYDDEAVEYKDKAGNVIRCLYCTHQLQALGRILGHDEIDEAMLKTSQFLEVCACRVF